MIIVYEKGTNKFVGLAPQVFDNGALRDHKLEELYSSKDLSKLGCIYVEDSPKYAVNPNHWQFKLDKKGVPVGVEHRPTLTISLSSDLKDNDKDGVLDLKADGRSSAVIHIKVTDGQKAVRKAVDLKLFTTAGRLSKRLIKTDAKGEASVIFQAGTDTVTVTITAKGDGMHPALLMFELMP